MTDETSNSSKIFLSYNMKNDSLFVQEVGFYLRKQPELEPFCYAEFEGNPNWRRLVENALRKSTIFVFFLGSQLGKTQIIEAEIALMQSGMERYLVLLDCQDIHSELRDFAADIHPIQIATGGSSAAEGCARKLVSALRLHWIPPDGLPIGYPFAYEKHIIEKYARNDESHRTWLLDHGCPPAWPDVEKKKATIENPLPIEVRGDDRDEGARIVVDARRKYHDPLEGITPAAWNLTMPEAGPRRYVSYPQKNQLKVGILVSGGIAPGINAVISGIIARHHAYQAWSQKINKNYALEILGYSEALKGLLHAGRPAVPLDLKTVREAVNHGGSILPTARADELLDLEDPKQRDGALDKVTSRLINQQIDILYIIGGDGSMRAAHAISCRARRNPINELSVIGIPKTMDNDILWVWQSFGFLSAVEFAKQAILQLHTEVMSNPRLCVIQLFGSDSGFVVSHAALASGVCDAVLIPEVNFTLKQLSGYIRYRLQDRPHSDKPYGGIVALAETAIPLDWREYVSATAEVADGSEKVILTPEELRAIETFESHGRRVHGQTPDALRSGGLRLVSQILQREIRKLGDRWSSYRVFTNEPRHLIRSIEPSVSDVIFAQRLGTLAVDNAMAGYHDFMISQWLTEYVLVPLKLVVLGRKRVPEHGIFWKSVRASTGQPDFV